MSNLIRNWNSSFPKFYELLYRISSVLSPPGLPAVEDSDIRSKVFYLIVVEDAIYEFATSRVSAYIISYVNVVTLKQAVLFYVSLWLYFNY